MSSSAKTSIAGEDYRASAGIDLEHDHSNPAQGQEIACDTLALPVGHFITEELPELTAQALTGFIV